MRKEKSKPLTQRSVRMVPPQWKCPFLYSATIYGQLCGVERSPPTMRKYSFRLLRSFSSLTRSFGAFSINLFVVPHFNSGHFTHLNNWFRLCGSDGHVSENRICCDNTCVSSGIFEINGPGNDPIFDWMSGSLSNSIYFCLFQMHFFLHNLMCLQSICTYSESSSISASHASIAQSMGFSHTGYHLPRKFRYKMPSVYGTINVYNG